ncbi:MAG: tRNA-dihydrouridine synthase [Actinomycetota bacterium]
MGWYAAVGRPLFFALPPETAHRVACAALGLPLPWSRIGHAADEPSLATEFCGLRLATPIGLAAGFDKTCAHLGALGSLGFGYVVGGTITRAARAGNPKPRIARSPTTRSMVNAMGLPNPGAEVAAQHLERDRASVPRFVSIADEALDDAVSSLDLLAPHADAIELNASCPNVTWGRDRDNEAHLRSLVEALRVGTSLPLLVKLPPFITDVEREVVLSLARIAQEAGADALTCSNTRAVSDTRVSTGTGGLSGKALWPHTARIVSEVREATAGAMPISACGGVFTAEDALTCLQAGATSVQVYSGLIYEGPTVASSIASGLASMLRDEGLVLSSLVGTAKRAS